MNPDAAPFKPSWLKESAPAAQKQLAANAVPFVPSASSRQQGSTTAPTFANVVGGHGALPPSSFHHPPFPGGGAPMWHTHHQQQQARAPPAPSLTPKVVVGAPRGSMPTPSAVPNSAVPSPPAVAASKLQGLPVFLFLGPRGSGKSTQAKMAAKKFNLLYLSSGDIIRDGKQPFIELGEQLQTTFKQGSYRGLALDRFLMTGETDMYFLEHCLLQHGMQIDLVFVFMMDHDVAQERVEGRTDDVQKPKSYQRRMMEHRAVYEVSTNLFEPLGKLRAIDCDDKGIEDVAQATHYFINEYMAKGEPTPRLPPSYLKGNTSLKLVPDFAKMQTIKKDIAAVLKRDPRYVDAFPGSQMTGVMDETSYERHVRSLRNYHVTVKADGQRVLVVRHTLGVYMFAAHYQAMYEQVPTPPPEAVREPPCLKSTDGMSMTTPISYIVDAEVITPTKEKERLAVYVFDFLFFFGLQGSSVLFPERFKMIGEYFGLKNRWGVFHAKAYVPITKLRELMPEYGVKQPFPIDGIIFQHSGFYTAPKDRAVFKWKPQEMCTVDFRLCDGVEFSDKGQWHFGAKVSTVTSEGVPDEQNFPSTVIIIPSAVVERDNLADGTVVECVKKGEQINGMDVWEYHRARPDKLTPNQKSIAEYTAAMKHIPYERLLQRCEYLEKVR